MSTCDCTSKSDTPLAAGLAVESLQRTGSQLRAQLKKLLGSPEGFDTGPRVHLADGSPSVSVVGCHENRIGLVAEASPGGMRTRVGVTIDLTALSSGSSDEVEIGLRIEGGLKAEATAVVRIRGAVRVGGRLVSYSHLEIVEIKGRDIDALLICRLRCIFVEIVWILERSLEVMVIDRDGSWIYVWVRQIEVRVTRILVCAWECVLVVR